MSAVRLDVTDAAAMTPDEHRQQAVKLLQAVYDGRRAIEGVTMMPNQIQAVGIALAAESALAQIHATLATIR